MDPLMSNGSYFSLFWTLLFTAITSLVCQMSADSLHGNLHGWKLQSNTPSPNKHGRTKAVPRQGNRPQRYPQKNQTENQKGKGPPRNEYYNPSYGYEPYWPGGDWALKWFAEQAKKNEFHHFCDDRCSPIYEGFGVVCGRNKRFEYRTFKNYCELRLLDCRGVDDWFIAYRGKCKTFHHLVTANLPARASSHIASLYDRHPHLKRNHSVTSYH